MSQSLTKNYILKHYLFIYCCTPSVLWYLYSEISFGSSQIQLNMTREVLQKNKTRVKLLFYRAIFVVLSEKCVHPR